MKPSMKGSRTALIIVLAIATGFDAMAIDMYMPAFSAIQQTLEISVSLLQASLALFLLGLALGQAIFGGLIDRYGRKKPLLAGLILFSLASAVLASATNANVFLIARFLQGIGGAAGLVIPRAVVADVCNAGESGRVFAVLMQIAAIAPVIAPPLGGAILALTGWRTIFVLLALIGLGVTAAAIRFVPESHPETGCAPRSLKDELRTYISLFCSPSFRNPMLASVFVVTALFAYIVGSPFLFIEYLGFSPSEYSFIFAGNALSMVGAGQVSIMMLKHMPENNVCRVGFCIHILSVLCLLAYCLYSGTDRVMLISLLLLCLASMAILFGPLTSLTMLAAPSSSRGAASAFLGIMQYVFGASAGLILGILHDGTLRPIGLLIACCSLLAGVLWLRGAQETPIILETEEVHKAK